MNFNISLKQLEIINYNDNEDILVIACPGSGKTHTIICKYIKIVTNNIFSPNEIILITFTKKAGNELSCRLNNMIPNNEPLYVGTIHGFAYKILKKYTNINYTILDEIDYKNYILNIAGSYEYNIKSNIISIIDQVSNSYPIELKKVLIKNNLEKYYKEFNKIYKTYQQKKIKENYIDFNDLMLLFSKFLDNDSQSNEFKNTIKYIFFDEYQDINPIQNYILTKLNEKSTLMLVGDDAQSIYSFRGSNIEYILNFNKKIFLLEENYRSTSNIINLCQNIINKNISQFNKNVISKINNITNYKPCMYHFESQIDLLKWLSKKIVKENESGCKLSDMVIMARTNIVLENAEIYLFNNNIKYTKHLGTLLLNKSHVRDFIAFIIVLYNPKSTVHWIRVLCLNNNYNISEASEIINSSKNIFKKLKNIPECKNLIELYNNINKVLDNEKINLILNYFKQNFNFSKNDLIDIEKLMKYFSNVQDLNDFINNVYLNHETKNENVDSLYLTTIHGAKGLEWNTVFLIDSINKHEKDEIEEERRLLYVATSRAKIKLNILCLTNKSYLLNDIDKKLYKTITK